MKSHEPLPWLRARRSQLGATALACAIAALVSAPVAQAKDGVRNLGGGLEQLAVPVVGAQAQSRQSLAAATSEEDLTFTPSVQFDDAGRALVRIALDGKTPAAVVLATLKDTPNVEVVASDSELSQRHGRGVRADRRTREPRRQARRALDRPLGPHGHQRRRNDQPGRCTAPRGQATRGRRRLRHHRWRDIRQLQHARRRQRRGRHRKRRSARRRQSDQLAAGRRAPGRYQSERHRRRSRDDADRARHGTEGAPRFRDGERRPAQLRRQHPLARRRARCAACGARDSSPT